ncbi:saccharopine dehydrogenase family protein [Salinimicrobium flavum]|uniref:Saccharopine dehydrogenase family protein n=1 Tax=Salinimicrobium flavum TaxID=1737065 RepID=A0ABW5IXZ3_9FLAO
MEQQYNIIIAGAGGIAEAAALMLLEWSPVPPSLFIGNRTLEKAKKMVQWLQGGTTGPTKLTAFHLPESDLSEEMKQVLQQGDLLLDCLPGSEAPRLAGLAKDYNLHYANLTEYVSETNEIISLAEGAKTGFLLQTGIAPGYINVLANGLFQKFCAQNEVDKVDKLEMRVGALTDHAVAPHYYGFTWSPVGVATEYLKRAEVLRDFKKRNVAALSERKRILINGIAYEEDLTSGGAANLPDALAGKVRELDYKTLRHPGHFEWVERQLLGMGGTEDMIAELQKRMELVIPNIEEDQIILYVAVEGRDAKGILRRHEIARKILPQTVGKHRLRAIQTTTAAPLLQSAQLLLETSPKGVIHQSEIDPETFLNGNFVVKVYGEVGL